MLGIMQTNRILGKPIPARHGKVSFGLIILLFVLGGQQQFGQSPRLVPGELIPRSRILSLDQYASELGVDMPPLFNDIRPLLLECRYVAANGNANNPVMRVFWESASEWMSERPRTIET